MRTLSCYELAPKKKILKKEKSQTNDNLQKNCNCSLECKLPPGRI